MSKNGSFFGPLQFQKPSLKHQTFGSSKNQHLRQTKFRQITKAHGRVRPGVWVLLHMGESRKIAKISLQQTNTSLFSSPLSRHNSVPSGQLDYTFTKVKSRRDRYFSIIDYYDNCSRSCLIRTPKWCHVFAILNRERAKLLIRF